MKLKLPPDPLDPFALNIGPLALAQDCFDSMTDALRIGNKRVTYRSLADVANDRGGRAE
ncbi:hypothetical protein SPHINGOT1_630010 [Sphingomonas sp. T1]|nr:hypothetical protein SPHINGOT1_630010 [Sphingomonas sp. T1]